MGLFRNKINDNGYDNIIEKINQCKCEDLESLLQKIEEEIEKSDKKDKYLLYAKTMVTSRIAVRDSSK